jgi:hypothetical protein
MSSTNNQLNSREISEPSNFTSRIVKIIPNPTNILMNPATFPIILVGLVLLYLSGGGDILIKNPTLVAGSLGGLFLVFIIVTMSKTPSWQKV